MQEEVDLLQESPAPVSAASISLPLGLIAISGGRGTRRDVQFSRPLLRWAEAGSERLVGGSISAVKVQREITFIPCFLPLPSGTFLDRDGSPDRGPRRDTPHVPPRLVVNQACAVD